MTTETDIQATYEKWLGSRADDPTLPHDLIRDAFLAGVEAERQTRGQPAVGEEIHVHIEGLDVLTLPLASSGIGAPRFVVHVPAQPDVSLTPDVQTDRQGRMPSDEQAAFQAWAEVEYRNEDTYNARDYRMGLDAWKQRARYGSGQPADDRAAYESGRRVGLDFAHSVVSEILRKHYYGSGIDGLNKLVQQAADVIAREKDNPTTATTDYGQPAASAELRPDEYDYFVDWYDKDAPDESEVSNFDMARHAWLAGMRFADLFPSAAPVAQEPVLRIYAEGSRRAVTEWLDGARDLPDGDHILFAAPVAAQAQPSGNPGELPVVNQQMTTDTALADTQRQIIEAAEQRGYARAMAECAQDRQDAERYRWARQFMRLDDVGDDQYSLGLVIDSERLEGCVSDEAARLDYERNQQRWANVKSPDDEPADIPVVTLNDAIDAARAAKGVSHG